LYYLLVATRSATITGTTHSTEHHWFALTALTALTRRSIFQSKNDTEIDFRFQRKVILKRQRRMNG
jgi:urease accessory protein UreE